MTGIGIGRLLAVWIAVALSGCIGAGGFQDRLRATTGELKYLHEAATEPAAETAALPKQPDTVGLGAVTLTGPLPPASAVARTGGLVIPLLFVNIWTGDYRGSLGAAELREDLPGFARRSLAEDLEQAATHPYVEHDPNLQVDVTISRVAVAAPIHEQGHMLLLLFWFAYSSQVRAGPVTVDLDGEVVVRRGGDVLRCRPIQVHARVGAGPPVKDWKAEDLTLDMVNALSLAVKEFNHRVVLEVNAL
jgi:hypothetical protein